ncbi:MAG: LemA family protein [Proteobacteria bacterium]|nr:LemA family protein [Pseudomonadota bacterium]NDF00674.1 LemA family protein [Verrucomicrobiota bacterium]
MKKTLIIVGAIGGMLLVGLVIIGLLMAGSYNQLVAQSQNVNKSWAQVQNVYQRRADLIPNLVQTVQGAANFEKSTLVEITDARASVGKIQINNAPSEAGKLAEFEQAQGRLSSALSRLLVVVEKYPDLKANSNFRDLQVQLEGTENRISVERGSFNDAVQSYNTAISSFPAVFYAGMFGFKERPYFAAKAGAEEAPKVQFDFGKPAPAK